MLMEAAEESETQRLRRHLRAMSAVNRSLYAQLEGGSRHGGSPSSGGGGGLAAARAWAEQQQVTSAGGEPYLASGSSEMVFLVEGAHRRLVDSGLLTAALSEELGQPRDLADVELERLDEGMPVEVFQGPTGRPFVLVGGRRISIRGLPLPHPVSAEEMQAFPAGAEVNIAAANVARARFEAAFTGKYQLSQARAAVTRKGVVPAARAFSRRVWRRLRPTSKG